MNTEQSDQKVPMRPHYENKITLTSTRRIRLYDGMSVLLNSRIDMLFALEIMLHEEKVESMKNGISRVIHLLKDGTTFADSICSVFSMSKFEYSTIRSGESSGKLEVVLSELATYFRNRLGNRRQIVTALTYPVIVILTSSGVLYFMLVYMVPMFTESFKRLNSDLPFITKAVIKTSELLKDVIPFILIFFILLILSGYFIKKDEEFKKAVSGYIFRIAFLRNVILPFEMNRFYTMMSTLAAAKVQITEAFTHAADIAIFPSFRIELEKIRERIINGMTIHGAIKESDLFTVRSVTLIRLAEETNDLERVFTELREEYRQSGKYKQQLFKSVAEPVMILVIGTITGIIVISMYLPVFQLSTIE